MKLEKLYKFVETLDEDFKGCVTYSRQDYSDIWIESRHKTEGYFITKEDLEKIVYDAFYMGRERTGLDEFEYDYPEDYWQEKLKEIENDSLL